jgi:hypothetical protein
MIATARSFANGGFGASGPSTEFVDLNWTTGSQKPTQILALHDESDKPGDDRIAMRWLAPTNLELSYDGKRQAIDFQAVKFAGVDISLRDISNGTANAGQ